MEEHETDNVLEELARLCDELGLEHRESEAAACDTHVFVDAKGNPHECWEAGFGLVNVTVAMTPEQAVRLTYPWSMSSGDYEVWYDPETMTTTVRSGGRTERVSGMAAEMLEALGRYVSDLRAENAELRNELESVGMAAYLYGRGKADEGKRQD